MKLTRRTLLKAGALLGGSVALTGCERVYSVVAEHLGQSIPPHISVAASVDIDPAFHLLSRAAFGPWPGELDYVRQIGEKAWLEEQLHPENIDDKACDVRARRFETIHLEPGTCYDFKREALRKDITRHTLLRAVYSRRQLLEVMVGFWTDHLNINIEKGDCMYLKAADDRRVIRKHALGRFSDLIQESAISPAMLVYLDGKENKKSGPKDIPNENYARELLELHTLGVSGGYTQKDVYETARCLTGWRLRTEWQKGTVYFDPAMHDDGEKIVLGKVIPKGGGESDLKKVVEIACNHPSTARYIAKKLVQKFVSDTPPESLVSKVEESFKKTSGDIKELLRTVLLSKEFQDSKGQKFKRPFHFVVSSLRALGADTHAREDLVEYLNRMGQGPFEYPTPDGYPEDSSPWMGTLLWRWNFALNLASNQIPNTEVNLAKLNSAIASVPKSTEAKSGEKPESGRKPFSAEKPESSETSEVEPIVLMPNQLLPHFIGRQGSASELAALNEFVSTQGLKDDAHRAELIGLILATPSFQRC